MKKLLLLASLMLAFCFSIQAQAIVGGAGVCTVDDDPDNITDMQTQDPAYECVVAWDNTNQALYVYNAGNVSGSRWQAVPLTTVSNTDTRLSNARVTGGTLTFDIIDVVGGNAVTGTVTVDVTDIAPIQSLTGGGDVTITDDGNGAYTITYNETVSGLAAGAGISITDDGAGTYTVTNTAPNVDQSFSVTNIGGLARLLVANGGNVDFIGGNGITISVSGNDVTIDSDISTTVFAKNHAAAGTAGIAIGEYFKASNDNTMGASPGTLIERRF